MFNETWEGGAETQGGVLPPLPPEYATVYTNSSCLTLFSFFHFPHPSFFPQESFTSLHNYRFFFTENSMVVEKQLKDCWGKNEGLGKMKKGRKWFSRSLFFPQILSFFPQKPLNGSWKCAIY